MAIGLTMCNQP